MRPDGVRILAYEKGTRDPSFDHIDYGALALRRSLIEDPARTAHRASRKVRTHIARRRRL